MADFVNNECGMYVFHIKHDDRHGALVTGVISRIYTVEKMWRINNCKRHDYLTSSGIVVWRIDVIRNRQD